MRTAAAQSLKIAGLARAFGFVAISVPLLWYREAELIPGFLAIGCCWLLVWVVERRPGLSYATSLVEGAATGVVCGLSLGEADAILVALALPPFAAAVVHGIRPAVLALSAELACLVLASFLWHGEMTPDEGLAVFTWSVAGVGLALIGSFLHSTLTQRTDELTPYLDAQHLIKRLVDLSGDLSSGLDVVALAGEIIEQVSDRLPARLVLVSVPTGETLVPLASHGPTDGEGTEAEKAAVESWARGEPLALGGVFAFPLGESAVVSGMLSERASLNENLIERAILELMSSLRVKAVQLDTALLFADFRERASSDVRTRLAREMHDGIAQDIASLGYVVDALSMTAATPQQAEQFDKLRQRVSAIVAEVRQSVLTLRTSIGEAASLGEAIGTVARHLSESSGIPIQVTLDEHSSRLRPEVEAELFRIAQEAMNNAIKHAQCTKIEVHCQVHAPAARITVTDDGRGLQKGRSDSHGLKIMQERARLAGAELRIEPGDRAGMVVSVEIAPATTARG